MSIQSSVNSALGSAAVIAGGVKAVQEEVKKKEAIAEADQLAELQSQNKDLTKQAEQLQKDLEEAKDKLNASSSSPSNMIKEGFNKTNLQGLNTNSNPFQPIQLESLKQPVQLKSSLLQDYLHLSQRSQNVQLAQQANLKAAEEIKNRQENRLRAFSIIDNFRAQGGK